MSRRVRCLVFDFDGVLVDSNGVKRGAYFEVLNPIGAASSLVEEILKASREGDRYTVIGEVIRRLGAGPGPGGGVERLIAECAERYNAVCEEFAATGPEMAGASSTLARLFRRYRLYMNSGTPEEPLRRIVERRGWRTYFQDVLGRPRTKVENLREILTREGLRPAELVMIGDGAVDLDAARACGCVFIGVRGGELEAPDVTVVDSLSELEGAIEAAGGGGPHARR